MRVLARPYLAQRSIMCSCHTTVPLSGRTSRQSSLERSCAVIKRGYAVERVLLLLLRAGGRLRAVEEKIRYFLTNLLSACFV